MIDNDVVARTLDAAPGPLPWYGRSAGNRIYGPNFELEWIYSQEINQSLLVERAGRGGSVGVVFGVGKIYTYPKSLSEQHFMLWWQESRSKGRESVQFRLFDAGGLCPVENWRGTWNEESDYLIGAPEIASFSIPSTMGDGVNSIALPRELPPGPEILVLVARPAIAIDLCIWRVDSEKGQLTVLPQRWWNESNFDFGYQWITRVAVEPTSGLIVGDGIRISPFVLQATTPPDFTCQIHSED